MCDYKKFLEKQHLIAAIAVQRSTNKDFSAFGFFIFHAIRKVQKISLSVSKLYPMINTMLVMEFSIGILMRSIMMDAMLLIHARKIFGENYQTQSFEELSKTMDSFAVDIFIDAAHYLIKDIKRDDVIAEVDKIGKYQDIIEQFKDSFVVKNDVPKPDGKHSYQIAQIFDLTKDTPELKYVRGVYSLYIQYSKYDHLSHYTAIFEKIATEKLKQKIHDSILVMASHLSQCLRFLHDFNNNEIDFTDLIDDITNYKLDENEG